MPSHLVVDTSVQLAFVLGEAPDLDQGQGRGDNDGHQITVRFRGMAKPPKKPASDPNVAAFRALRDANKSFRPEPKSSDRKPQKPRAKQQLRRRP